MLLCLRVQQNSDVTFRLYDWGHMDAKTGQPRPLQVDQALASIDFADSTGGLVTPIVVTTTPVERERLFDCEHFLLWRLRGESPFNVGAAEMPRVLVCIEGSGWLEGERLRIWRSIRAKYGSCLRWSAHVNFTPTTQ